MKCGRELKGELNFCPSCQEDMKRFPVSAATPVQLPVRPVSAGTRKKNRSRKTLRPEEQVHKLKGTVRWLVFALVVTLIAFGLTVAMILMLLDERDHRSDPVLSQCVTEMQIQNVSRETF